MTTVPRMRLAPPTSSQPTSVTRDLRTVSDALDAAVPAKHADNLLLGTWNIRALSALTDKWDAREDDSPKRDWHAVACLAEVVSRFDVVAVQELRRDTTAMHALLMWLGAGWEVIVSDVTEGDAGNGERLSYIYDARRVRPSGLVGEIVLPPTAAGAVRQFARSPYVASFERERTEFVLATVHVLWGDSATDRLPEIEAFADWMSDWARRPREWNENLMVLGDFNLDRLGDPLFEAFTSTGLWPPAELNHVPRTVFGNDNDKHFYDQIAWFSKPSGESLLHSLDYTGRAGSFDFVPHAFTGLTRAQQSWRMSDHYPLWAEFSVAS